MISMESPWAKLDGYGLDQKHLDVSYTRSMKLVKDFKNSIGLIPSIIASFDSPLMLMITSAYDCCIECLPNHLKCAFFNTPSPANGLRDMLAPTPSAWPFRCQSMGGDGLNPPLPVLKGEV